ncbi:MAG TPA: hypothetical protein VFF06_17025 [Polyangia bacterium]|nr:hypothetical protein [Polyangia bacterium]
MAPFIGPSRAALLRVLRGRGAERKLPLTLGHYAPQATVAREPDGRFTIRPLAIDRARADEAGRRALAAGEGWMPEQEWQFLAAGEPLVAAATLAELTAAVERMEWPFGGRD